MRFSIDLGSSICIAVCNNGKIEIVLNEKAKLITPSYISFTNSNILFGEDAKNSLTANTSTNTLYFFHRLINCNFGESPYLQLRSQRWPIDIVSHRGRTCAQIEFDKQTKYVTPMEVAAFMLRNASEAVCS